MLFSLASAASKEEEQADLAQAAWMWWCLRKPPAALTQWYPTSFNHNGPLQTEKAITTVNRAAQMRDLHHTRLQKQC